MNSAILPIENPISYWHNSESLLKSTALEILSVPASSAPVERMFTKAGKLLSPLRSSLSSEMLEKLLLISMNN